LNPIIGPEPITGSTRMKSGTTTKIIIDIIVLVTIIKMNNQDYSLQINEIIDVYQNVLAHICYSKETIQSIGSLIDKAAQTLRNKGSINYISNEMNLGLIGCIDASECIPTFGAHRNHVKGFIHYDSMRREELKNWNNFIQKCHKQTTTAQLFNKNDKNSLFIIINKKKNEIANILSTQNNQIVHLNLSMEESDNKKVKPVSITCFFHFYE
jgi:hypothetical protein